MSIFTREKPDQSDHEHAARECAYELIGPAIAEEIQGARDELDSVAYFAYDRLSGEDLSRIANANRILAELQANLRS